MSVTSVSHIKSGVHVLESRLALLAVRLRTVCSTALQRLTGRLRPVEWVLLLVGTVAFFLFVYVLWRQPVSRR